jgi:hypothetical protein
MRSLTAALLVSLALSARADEPATISLEVGERTKPLGIMPRCDDLTVVRITEDGRGVQGVRPGQTLCSFDESGGGGARRVYRIVVAPRGPPSDGERSNPRRGRAPRAARTRSGS